MTIKKLSDHINMGTVGTTAHLGRWQPNGGLAVQCAFQQLVTKDVIEVLGHDSLLLNTAVVFNGQDDWIFRYLFEGRGREADGVSDFVIEHWWAL